MDTSGRHKQESALFEEMQDIREAVSPDNIVFILDATQGQAVHDQAASFHEAVCRRMETRRRKEKREEERGLLESEHAQRGELEEEARGADTSKNCVE